MSALITDVADALGVPAEDVCAIVSRLSDIDYDDTIDHSRVVPYGTTIKHTNGNRTLDAYLTPAAVKALFLQFNGSRDVLKANYGIESDPCFNYWGEPSAGELQCDRLAGHSGEHHVEQFWTSE